MVLHVLPIIDNELTHPAFVPRFKSHNSQKLLNGFSITENLTFVRKIGAGTYGLIYLVRDNYGKEYAAKIVLKDPLTNHGSPKDIEANKKYIQQRVYTEFVTKDVSCVEMNLNMIEDEGVNYPYLKEVALHLKAHQHPNVVTIHKVFNVNNFAIMILMDYYEQGDLFTNIVDKQIFNNLPKYQVPQLTMKNAALQIIDAIQYLASKNIYHCDLKPENIMIRHNPNYIRTSNSPIIDYNEIQIALIDFGLSIQTDLICCNACRGSSFYMAPERIVNYNTNDYIKSIMDINQFQRIKQEHKSEANSLYLPTLPGDVWSIGVLLINLTCSRNPWPTASIIPKDGNQVFSNYITKDKFILQKILPISSDFNMLLNRVFELNPNERIDLHELALEVESVDFFNATNKQLHTPPESPTFSMDSECSSF